jgi:hypothetical protein
VGGPGDGQPWFHAVGVDMEVHSGDSFGYEFCHDDFID